MLNLTTSRRSRARTLFAGTALAGTFFGLTVAFAQETTPPPPSSGVEQVVVTARRRAEDPVKLPGQDTAFTAQMIDAKGITLPQEFLDAVPNVTFIPTQNAGTSFVVMRTYSFFRRLTRARSEDESVLHS